jgi:branched-chain amino acid transport system permease protein
VTIEALPHPDVMTRGAVRPARVYRIAGLAVLLIAASALPFFISDYRTFQFTLTICYAITLLGLNILTGYNGQISLGHGAFFAIGAYTAAIMMDRWDLPYWSTIPAAGLVCLGAGFLFGLPATPQILKYKGIEHWTGGVQGIVIVKPPAPFGLPISPDKWLYLFALAVAVAMFVLGVGILRGRVGRALIAIRDHPTAAAAMGVNTALYKSLTFGVSALYTGVGGALSALAIQFVAPDSFGFFLSISFLVGIVVGGLASVSGAIFGAFFIQFIPNVADHLSKSAPWAVYGVFLIAFMYFMPTGVAGALQMIWARFCRTR